MVISARATLLAHLFLSSFSLMRGDEPIIDPISRNDDDEDEDFDDDDDEDGDDEDDDDCFTLLVLVRMRPLVLRADVVLKDT